MRRGRNLDNSTEVLGEEGIRLSRGGGRSPFRCRWKHILPVFFLRLFLSGRPVEQGSSLCLSILCAQFFCRRKFDQGVDSVTGDGRGHYLVSGLFIGPSGSSRSSSFHHCLSNSIVNIY
ncbi:hypothetical protein Ancab_017071 [Ancistrocladus abbreviatus]